MAMEKPYCLKRMEGVRALITGGLGFFGSNIAHKLVSLGADVVIYDACLDPYGWNFANIKEIRDKVKFVKGDIRDEELMEKSVSECDIIFNCAAQVSHVDSMKDPYLDLDINCRGQMTLLEACRKKNDGVKIVYAGTRGQIGVMVYSPVDENHPCMPTDVYGANKHAGELYHLLYCRVYGIKVCSIRANNTYGPRHQMKHGRYGILNWFVRKAMLGETIEVYGDGMQAREYNYIDDTVDAFILAAQSERAWGEVFLLGSGSPVKFIDMVKAVVRAVGKGSYKIVPWPKERKSIEVGDFVVSYGKIRKMLGWEPTTNLEEGLAKTVGFYKERLAEYIN
ncbi:MAG: SDR family NAD(P)-dependent oxidoreductase [Candidatus Micrarchaeia archaeon]